MVLGIIALILFIWSCTALVTSAGKGVQQYNQQNPACQISNPAWPNC